MNIVKLDDVANFINGGAWNQSEYTEKGIPVVRVSDIHHATVDLSQCKYLPHSAIEKYAKNRLEAGDLVICTVGSHATQPNSVVGRPGIIPAHCRGTLLNQNAVCIRPKNNQINKLWLGYLARSQKMKDHIIAHARGSASQVRVAISALKDFEFEIPSLIEQETVSKILNNYDKLIENNNRRIAILEDMAESLYREWFVNFRYPGHADAVDKDGNQKLIDSPLGQIPEGWEVGELKEFCSKIGSGATPRGGKGAYKNEGVPLIRSMNIYDSTLITKNLAFIDDVQAARLKNVVVEPDDVLLNITGASVARCSIVPSAFTPARVNQHVAIIRLKTNQLSSEYLMYTLISANGKARLLSTAQGGATREALTKTDIEKFKVVVPPRDIINKFNLLAQVAVKQKEVLFLKNENLKQQRDMLLPKLISGTIEL
jgi:type I restriction enzyme S subunit